MDVITHPYPNLNGGVNTLSFKLENASVITSHILLKWVLTGEVMEETSNKA